MNFSVDNRIEESSIALEDWELSRVFLKNESRMVWFILVPRVDSITEIEHLNIQHQHQVMDEITKLSRFINLTFKPDKINVGALGNLVAQLHIHVVGRFTHDPFWPHGIWQPGYTPLPYSAEELTELKSAFKSFFASVA
ncbi:HIT domain-containing protein [Legionella londiniensis]|uniref:Diadenosine tetraphosphate (Ap4A) hydrolase-like HIT family hydrolase n=1 Tax=Legionella londiniensis TaxID=45068 RepID=A0A0W0VLV4_9GAMM|nr:HIT domain-containing protein [Legionella londiniensis]KTD21131.1 diadenosine tetraphosphate (Ap4A) hydrolase-like HIT family hydrolase [Legionella londiniensis]STX93154.1 diadenosine tetraphosphate (Ap4A) hydrolase-like HIT family hydrolase [Legionella londiniensis]